MENFTVSSSPSFHGNLSRRRYSFNGSVQTGLTSNSPTKIPPPNLHLEEEPSFSSYLGAPPGAQHGYKKAVLTRKFYDEKENEISIFAAEKYFNETQSQQQSKENKLGVPSSSCSTAIRVNNEKNDNERIVGSDEYAMLQIERNSSLGFSSSVVDGYGKKYRTRSVQSTPTVSSEASWNSQSGLLHNLPRGSINGAAMKNNNLNSEQGKKSGSPAKWIFGRKCCFGRKFIQVQENLSEQSKVHHLHNHRVLNNGFHLNNSINPRLQTGEIGIYKSSSLNERTNKFDFEKNLKGIDGRDKQELLYRNREKENEVSGHSAHFAPENKLSVEIGCRAVPQGRSFHEAGGFSFPAVLNPLIVGKPMNQLNSSTRDILESLPLPDNSIKRKSNEIDQRKLMSPSFIHDPQSFNLPVSQKPQAMIKDEDIESDTSSDLFEIESISNQTTSYPIVYQQRDYNYLEEEISSYKARRQSLDEPTTPSMAQTELYEPSEASINWSVTTADGFDRVSFTNFSIGVASPTDYEEAKFFVPGKANSTAGGGGGKPRVNGLLGCRCENSVNVDLNPARHVAELQPRKCYDYRQPIRAETDRIHALSKFANMSSTDVKRSSIIKPPLPEMLKLQIASQYCCSPNPIYEVKMSGNSTLIIRWLFLFCITSKAWASSKLQCDCIQARFDLRNPQGACGSTSTMSVMLFSRSLWIHRVTNKKG